VFTYGTFQAFNLELFSIATRAIGLTVDVAQNDYRQTYSAYKSTVELPIAASQMHTFWPMDFIYLFSGPDKN
jgi:hypothetical protein